MKEMNTKRKKQRVFSQNPHDIETFFESLKIASQADEEIFFIDNLVSKLRKKPKSDLADLSYQVLTELELIQK